MLSEDQKKFIETKILKKIVRAEEDVNFLKERTKPISPENAIGRVSRMDAINNKSVAEESLRQAIDKLARLKEARTNINNDSFDQCQKCKKTIAFKRIAFMPESRRCARCAR